MYSISATAAFDKQLEKLDEANRSRIIRWIESNLESDNDPCARGKALKGKFKQYWAYRVGDYRIVAHIKDDELVLILVSVAHRKKVYEIR